MTCAVMPTLAKRFLLDQRLSPADGRREHVCQDVCMAKPRFRITRFRIIVAAMLSVSLYPAHADVLDEPDLKEEIVLRCHYEMGEFGAEAVRSCIETDNAALGALSAYPKPARPIISRCAGQLRGNGWEVIKLCVDKDIEAEAALAQYPPEHAQAIDACRAEIANQGATKVKACVDQRIAAKRRNG
jgi:hypothetical protein